MGVFKCKICGNEDPKYIGYKNGKPYCRYCISFRGEPASQIPKNMPHSNYSIKYELSEDQKRLSSQILENFKNKINVLVYAVTGAGKTELVFEVISYALKNKLNVGFAIPRRDVVIELAERLKFAFSNTNVISIFGGHTSTLNGEIIVLTTHQLYRFEHYFDLLILDEIDAFPYKNNNLLLAMFKRSVRGNIVLLSATPSDEYMKNFEKEGGVVLKLFKRFHNHKLPEPKIVKNYGLFKYISLLEILKKFQKENKPVFIFVSKIDESYELYLFLKPFFKSIDYVSSQREGREEIINRFKENKIEFLITTSILERGVTVDNLQVIVFNADAEIFDTATLIQISGRAGRKLAHPDGEVFYIASKITKDMNESINKIKEINQSVMQVMF